jgi:glycosyltransferase involved in cell wall biosynthesis
LAYGNSPLVSVVLIFLDAERFLEEAVASVFAQRYPEWELLLVDDGSTDGSTAIARRHAERHRERVRYLEHPGHRNRGKSVSRNLGIREGRGEYVAFLDADDVFLSEKLTRQVAVLQAHPEAVMVYGRTQYWFSWDPGQGRRRRDFVGKLGVPVNTVAPPPQLVTRFLRDPGVVPCICSVLARRQVVDDVGGFDEAIRHLYEDQVFLAKLCLNGLVAVDGGCGERYRQHPDSSSNRAITAGEYHPWRPNTARKTFLDWLSAYLSERSIDDEALWRALRRETLHYRHPFYGRVMSPLIYAGRVVRGLFEPREAMPSEAAVRSRP